MTNGQKVIAAARTKRGCAEWPPRSNDGACVNEIQASTGAFNLAWCGSFVKWAFDKAGVDLAGTGSASTWWMVELARQNGVLGFTPVPGSPVVWRPGAQGHTEIFIGWTDRERQIARTIGGNTGDAVREHDLSVAGAFFIVPPSLKQTPPPPVYKTVYWWEDPAAEPVRHQLRNTREASDKDAAAWVARHGNPGHIRRGIVYIKRHGKRVPVYTFWTGQRKRSIDFPSKAQRDVNMAAVAAQRPGHILRARSKRTRVS